MAELGEINGELLLQAVKATFDARKTHEIPGISPNFPASWSIPFRKLIEEVGLSYRSLEDANIAVMVFLNPIFPGKELGNWDPVHWAWRRE
jgi:hypothetical protein